MSRVRVLVSLKTRCVEGLIPVEFVEAQSPLVGGVEKFRERILAQMSSSSLDSELQDRSPISPMLLYSTTSINTHVWIT
ncbi:hypothetical protein TNCV_2517731 [Trichonephila clavipes]|nr:hypothetical protein TNCV_2517731 [Trichonephila clavipes]